MNRPNPEQDKEEEKAEEEVKDEPWIQNRNWRPQIVGSVIGAFVFFIAGGIAQYFGWLPDSMNTAWLWGAVLGGLVGSLDSLEHAGSILTKKENKWLNIAVALVGMAVIFSVLLVMVQWLGRFLSSRNF